jgi:flagellar capping protein FliD
VINGQTGKILFVSEAKGAVHDFEMYKQSGLRLHDDILFVGDSGFQGVADIHLFSVTPFKKPKGGELTEEQKEFNRSLAKYRTRIEHVNRRIKRFKIFQQRYRNKQRRHLLRFALVCGIYNYELNLI